MTFVAALLLAGACAWWGRQVLPAFSGVPVPAGTTPAERLPELLAGLLGLHLLLTGLQTLGIPWSRLSLVAAFALLGAGTYLVRLRRSRTDLSRADAEPRAPRPRVHWREHWGDGLAVLATIAVVASAFTLRSVHPDFVYHWGIKAKKFWLAGGVDFAYLSHPWNHYTHPDYPNLLPELYATVALMTGKFREPGLVAASALFFGGLMVAARETLRVAGPDRFRLQAGTALVALAAATFTLGYHQPGGADLLIALAILAAAPGLRPGASERQQLTVGLAAAFAAASKIEGVPLAAILVAAGLGFGRGRKGSLARAARMAVPPALVILPWAAACLRHDLFQATNTGALDLGRWRTIAGGLAASMAVTPWHGFPYVLVLAPLLLFVPRSRPLAAVVLAQLAFYLYVYFSTPVDVDLYIRTSLPRLLFHLAPGALVAAMIALGPKDREQGRVRRPADPPTRG